MEGIFKQLRFKEMILLDKSLNKSIELLVDFDDEYIANIKFRLWNHQQNIKIDVSKETLKNVFKKSTMIINYMKSKQKITRTYDGINQVFQNEELKLLVKNKHDFRVLSFQQKEIEVNLKLKTFYHLQRKYTIIQDAYDTLLTKLKKDNDILIKIIKNNLENPELENKKNAFLNVLKICEKIKLFTSTF